ncbi:MAG: CdaR family protein [Acidobacteriota bacterium]
MSRRLRNVNLPLFLVAVFVALMIKVSVRDTVQLTERVIEAQVTYSFPQPESELVTFDLVDTVRVGVRGKSGDVSRLSPFTVEVLAAIPPGRTGQTTIVLDAADVRFNIPGDFSVQSIDPNRFDIKIEQRVTRPVPIRPVLTGEPAAGARAGEPTLDPATAMISGPRSRVQTIDHALVEVNLDGHARSFEELVPVSTTDSQVRVIEPTRVLVTVPMEEPELSIRIDDLQEDPS